MEIVFVFNNNTSEIVVNSNTGQDLPDMAAHAGGAPMGELPALRGATLSKAHIGPFIEYNRGSSILRTSKGIEGKAVGGGKRGRVKGFSTNSRRRLLYTIGAIRKDAELPNFVTLTYPDAFPTVERAKRDLKVFRQRLQRRFPGAGGIWKLEPQERGAPHYHVLIWGCKTSELFGWVVENWYEIAGNGDKNHLLFHMGVLHDSEPCVRKVESFRGVWSYAAKYLGKTFEVAEWGDKWTGRFWGYIQRELIPFGEKVKIPATYRSVVDCMRYQRRFSGIRSRAYNSVTIFCDADQWVRKLFREVHRC